MLYRPLESEEQLLAEFAMGDRAATERIYKQHFKIINGWILKNGGSTDDAADVFQEAMMVMYEKAQAEDFRLQCKIGTYVFAISKNLWLKKMREEDRLPSVLIKDTGNEDGPDAAYEDDLNLHIEKEAHFEQLGSALEQLGEPCRSLLKAFYEQNKTMQEISADFGYTNPENAKTQKYKCLTRLRKLFYAVKAN
jgi:RNA polymerase sigma factor (sigma-70 family)